MSTSDLPRWPEQIMGYIPPYGISRQEIFLRRFNDFLLASWRHLTNDFHLNYARVLICFHIRSPVIKKNCEIKYDKSRSFLFEIGRTGGCLKNDNKWEISCHIVILGRSINTSSCARLSSTPRLVHDCHQHLVSYRPLLPM